MLLGEPLDGTGKRLSGNEGLRRASRSERELWRMAVWGQSAP